MPNTVQVGSVALAAAEPLIKDGQLRALAVTSEKRWFSLPDVPTMIEAGYPGFISDTFNALFAPAAVPPGILAVLVQESRAAFESRGTRAGPQGRLRGRGRHAGTARGRISLQFQSVRELVEKAGIKPE